MLKISAFYLVKQKGFIPREYNIYAGLCSQYQNKKALFTDPISSDGFVFIVKKNSLGTQQSCLLT